MGFCEHDNEPSGSIRGNFSGRTPLRMSDFTLAGPYCYYENRQSFTTLLFHGACYPWCTTIHRLQTNRIIRRLVLPILDQLFHNCGQRWLASVHNVRRFIVPPLWTAVHCGKAAVVGSRYGTINKPTIYLHYVRNDSMRVPSGKEGSKQARVLTTTPRWFSEVRMHGVNQPDFTSQFPKNTHHLISHVETFVRFPILWQHKRLQTVQLTGFWFTLHRK